MTIITDPDFLDQDREVFIDTATRKFRMVIDTDTSPSFSPISRMDQDGASGQAMYSFFKEEWKNTAALIPHPFPMIAITPEQFEFIEDWEPQDNVTRKRIRTAGWREISELDTLKREYFGVISLGSFRGTSPDDQAYYQQGNDPSDTTAAVDFDRAGPVNEAVLSYEEIVPADTTSPGHTFGTNTITRNDGGSFVTDGFQVGARVVVIGDTSSSPSKDGTYVLTDVSATILTVSGAPWAGITGSSQDARLAKEFRNAFNILVRPGFGTSFGATFAKQSLSDIGVTELTYQAYRFPLSSGDDLKITNADGTIAARSPEVSITYYQAPQRFSGFVADLSSTISPNTEAEFGVVIDAQGYSAEEVYEFVQYQLRQNADINDGGSPITIINGSTADPLLEFVGDSLQTLFVTNPLGGGGGVYITNFDSNDTNRISFADNEFGTTTRRTFPFVAAGTINFNANLQNDADAEYWMFFEYTERFTGAITLSGAAGSTAVVSMPSVDLVSELSVSDYINLQGFTDPNNNGIWQVDSFNGGVSPQTINATRINGDTVSNEAGPGTCTLAKNPIDSDDAIIVNSATGSPQGIAGLIDGASSVAFDFDYDGNVQGGRSAGTDAAIRLRAIGLSTAQYVEATGTITRNTGLSFTLTAALERNYSNA
jgi:hypothetical protein